MACMVDEFKFVRRYRKSVLAVICGACYLIGLCCVTKGGIYVFNIFDRQSGGFSLIFVSIFECLVIGWAYGVDRFSDNIEEMIGKRPSLYFQLCWKYISPTIVTTIFAWSCTQWTGLSYNNYKYPISGELIGWGLALASMMAIPIYAMLYIYRSNGSLRTRLKDAFTPEYIPPLDWETDLKRKLNIVIGNQKLQNIVSMSVSVELLYRPERFRIGPQNLPKRSNSIPSSWIRGLNLPEPFV